MVDNSALNLANAQNYFIDILVSLGFVDRAKLSGMESKTEEEIVKFIENGICTKEQIARAYSAYFNLPLTSLKDKKIDLAVLKTLPKEDASNFKVVCFSLGDNKVDIAIGDPKILKTQPPESLKKLAQSGKVISLSIVPSDEIDWAIGLYDQNISAENTPAKPVVPPAATQLNPTVIKSDIKEPAKLAADQPVVQATSVQALPVKPSSGKYEEIDLLKIEIPKEVLLKFPKEVAQKYKMVVFDTDPPIKETKNTKKIKVALIDPDDVQTKEILEFIRKRNNIEIIKFTCSEEGLKKALTGYGVPAAASPVNPQEVKKSDTEDVKKTEPAIEDKTNIAVEKEVAPPEDKPKVDVVPEDKSKVDVAGDNALVDQKLPSVNKDLKDNISKVTDASPVVEIKEIDVDKTPVPTEKKIDQMQNLASTVLKLEEQRVKEGVAQPYNNSDPKKTEVAEIIPEIKAEDIDNKAGLESSADMNENLEENNLDKFLTRPVDRSEDLQAVIRAGMVPEIVAGILSLGIVMQASDIHMEAAAENVRLRYRVDGILKDIVKMPLSLHAPIVSRIKILSKLKIDEQRVPQDGRFNVIVRKHEIDLRVSTLPTVHGEKVVMRILDKSAGLLTLEDMGITGVGFDVVIKNIKKPYGIILATGPTGSGKSTTLYAVLQRISTNAVNVITLEDPVEYEISGINQVQIKPQIGFTFAEGLRSVLRQDPNIVMVGEIRDLETAAMTTHAALTGHLVLSTLHTNNAAGALPRLINMGVEPFLITSSVNCIIAQRLVRKICTKCKERVELPSGFIEDILKEISKIPDTKIAGMKKEDLTFFHGKGCSECTNGYHGRMGIYEVLEMSEKIEELAVEKRPANDISEQACKDGMITMKQDGILKALKGITTMDEVLRVTSSD